MREVAAGAILQFRVSAWAPLSIVTSFLTPLALGFVIISLHGRPTPALLAGTVVAGMWNTMLLQTTLAALQERAWGTLQLLAATPAGLVAPLAGRLLGAVAQGLVVVPVVWLFAAAVWGVPEVGPPTLALAFLVVSAVGLAGLAAMLMALMIRIRFYSGMLNGIFPLTMILIGAFAPIMTLPLPLRGASRLLAPSWAMEAMRGGTYRPLMAGAMIAVAWAVVGLWQLSRLQVKLRTSPSAYFQ